MNCNSQINYNKQKGENKMTKQQTINEVQLEMAAEPIPFLDGEYFRGMCEIAAASHSKKDLFIPTNTKGIFDSLFGKRVYARKQNTDGSFTVGNFVMQNRYLYDYDRNTRTYGAKKEENYAKFLQLVKEIVAKDEYKVFSIQPIQSTELDQALEDVLA